MVESVADENEGGAGIANRLIRIRGLTAVADVNDGGGTGALLFPIRTPIVRTCRSDIINRPVVSHWCLINDGGFIDYRRFVDDCGRRIGRGLIVSRVGVTKLLRLPQAERNGENEQRKGGFHMLNAWTSIPG